MTYDLSGGERGSFTVGGRWAGPIRLAGGMLLGLIGAAIVWIGVSRETRYLEPSNDYFIIFVALMLLLAVAPPLFIWSGLRKECIGLTVDDEKRRIDLSWQGITSTWSETMDFDAVEYFSVGRRSGKPVYPWEMRLHVNGKAPIVVAKFRSPQDAEHEKDNANRVLQRVPPALQGIERDWRT